MLGFLATFRSPHSDAPTADDDTTWRVPGVSFGAHGFSRLVRRGPWVGAVDARLVNATALHGSLNVSNGADWRATHAEILVAAFAKWGTDAVDHLEGIFAGVIWNHEQRRGIAVRDRMGVRPLFRASLSGGGFSIGSHLREVRDGAPWDLNRQKVADFLAGAPENRRATFNRSIERIPAASVIEFDSDFAHQERRYWHLNPNETVPGNDDETEGRFRELFDTSVRASLTDEPGAFLSGGLDSSAIAITARLAQPQRTLPTFSIVYSSPEADETRYLDAVLEEPGMTSHRVEGETLSPLARLDADLAAVGEPYAMPNLFLTAKLYEEAHRAGLGAVLDGFAGDNVVGHGELRLTDVARSLRLPTLAREIMAISRTTNRPRRMARDLVRDYVLAPMSRRGRAGAVPSLSFANADLPPALPQPPPIWRDRAAHNADLSSPLLPHAFEVAYAVATDVGIDPRFPFASAPLASFCLSLPSNQRLRDGLTRSVFRRAMVGRLPELVRLRAGKARLASNFSDALFVRDAAQLRQLMEEEVPAASDVLDVAAMQEAYSTAKTKPATRPVLALPLWRAVVVARWLTITRVNNYH